MKSFFFGFFGFLCSAIVFSFFYAGYSDYRAEAEMGGWCITLKEKIKEINKLAEKEKQLINVASKIKPFVFSEKLKISNHHIFNGGSILVQGGIKNQLMVLQPKIFKNEITWRAFQAPSKLITGNCKQLPNKKLSKTINDD